MVDLPLVAQQIRLDQFAVAISRVLTSAEVPHALLKGPTTANWLYHPPRTYSDVDMLIPRSRVDDSVRALGRAGLAHPSGGRLGEEAAHCLMMASPSGIELDLHVALPLMSLPDNERDDRVWDALAGHVLDFDIDGEPVPALNVPARCLVLALHAVSGGPDRERVREDLRRARRVAERTDWEAAAALAERLDVAPLMRLGLSTVEVSRSDGAAPITARLALTGQSGAFRLQTLSELPRRQLPAAVWREIFPSRGFMRRSYPDLTAARGGVARAHIRRLIRLARALPCAFGVWRSGRRPTST